MNEQEELIKLRAFFKEIASLTINHDITGEEATVSPSKLGFALEKVNANWYQEA
jgi:hypothetical protein